MCGIGLYVTGLKDDFQQISPTNKNITPNTEGNIQNIANVITPRGPDGTHHVQEHIDGSNVTLFGSLLALRGLPTPQPLVDQSKNHVLCWNGEVFGDEQIYQQIKNRLSGANDTAFLMDQLSQYDTVEQSLNLFSKVEGPFSFIYLNRQNYLLFGRDIMGRRSLLYSLQSNSYFALSSTACALHCSDSLEVTVWEEIPNNGIYHLDLSQSQHQMQLHPWENLFSSNSVEWPLKKRLPEHIAPPDDYVRNDVVYDDLVSKFTDLLLQSTRKRVVDVYNHGELTRVGVLFSGGIDSVIITALAHVALNDEQSDQQQHIDLLNVSFGNDSKQMSNAADRKQAIQAFEELKSLYPSRCFNLVLIDVTNGELASNKQNIERLIYPRSTVLDFNIGAALWFASTGVGRLYGDDSNQKYVSTAKVLLCGIGSDEQLAGYGRHRTSFMRKQKHDWSALNDELDVDVGRLWIRNLGRDDRLISSHGKESRNPFLDEDFMRFCRNQPLWYLTDLRREAHGDKMILRDAADRMGLKITSKFVKRAIQFGSNIAKVSHKKQDGDCKINIELF
ncbi:asparagine synthetase domain-containing protein [Acrasis kona]|uniref:Asparagine synthetase domain-containing protein n=1 Tax=Acrasis kona TaxID=1008807 RepID=A0AAW2ZNP3_9EUKA